MTTKHENVLSETVYVVSYDNLDNETVEILESAEIADLSEVDDFTGELITQIETMQTYERAKVFYLIDNCGSNLEQAIEDRENVCIYQETLRDYAYTAIEEGHFGIVPEELEKFINYDAVALYIEHCGYREFVFAGEDWTAHR